MHALHVNKTFNTYRVRARLKKLANKVFFSGVVKTRNAGIWRNIREYGEKSGNMAEYQDIFPEYTGTSQYFPMVAMRLFINMDV
jgi:hypothetical protein